MLSLFSLVDPLNRTMMLHQLGGGSALSRMLSDASLLKKILTGSNSQIFILDKCCHLTLCWASLELILLKSAFLSGGDGRGIAGSRAADGDAGVGVGRVHRSAAAVGTLQVRELVWKVEPSLTAEPFVKALMHWEHWQKHLLCWLNL